MSIARIAAVFLWVLLPASLPAQGWEWQNPLPHGLLINAMAALDHSRAFAVCNNGMVLGTWDTGLTWSPQRLGNTDLQDIVRMGDGSLVIVSGDGHFFRSTDDGATWPVAQRFQISQSVYTSDLERADSNTVVCTLGGAMVAISRDCGQQWERVSDAQLNGEWPRSISAQSPRLWWLVTLRNTFRSNDAGLSWERTTDSLPPRGLQRFTFVDSLHGYQLRDGQLLQTSNGGADWKEMDIFGFGSVKSVAVGPTLGEHVFCLSNGRYVVNASPDLGQTWNISLTESAFQDAEAMCMLFFSGERGLVAGVGGRILRTSNAGQSWDIVHGQGYIGSIANVHFADAQRGLALTYSPTVLLSSNGGKRWDESIPVPDHTLGAFDDAPSGRVFCVGISSSNAYSLYSSSDVGRSWEKIGPLPFTYGGSDPSAQNLIPQSLVAFSDDEFWISASYGYMFHSSNRGATWDTVRVTGIPGAQDFAGEGFAAFPSGLLCYAFFGRIAVSTNGGASWEARGPTPSSSLYSATFVNERVWHVISNGRLLRSVDAGFTWTTVSTADVNLYHFVDENIGYFTTLTNGSEGSVSWLHSSSDGGVSWQQSTLKGRADWYGWFFLDRNRAWAYGPGGLIQHTSNGGVLFTDGLARPSSAGTLGVLYPHPLHVGGSANLRVVLSTGGLMQLTLYDIGGRNLGTVMAAPLPAGEHVVPLALPATLTPGSYMLRLSGEGVFAVRRFSVVE